MNRQHLQKWAKAGIAVLFAGALFVQLQQYDMMALWGAFLQQCRQAPPGWLLAAIALCPLNWLFETLKWQPLLHNIIGLGRGYRAVLAGVTFSIFTPNRLGEPAGRLLFVPAGQHWKALAAHAVGSMAQLWVLFVGGTFGGCWLLLRQATIPMSWCVGGAVAAGIVLAGGFFFYLYIGKAVPWLARFPLLSRLSGYVKDVQIETLFQPADLLRVIGWAMLRYVVYAGQYFLLLRFFSIQVTVIEGFSGVFALYALQTGIPLPPVTGLAARGSLAVWMWSLFGANALSALGATFVLWIINLVLPALVGTFFIFHVNIAKSVGHEDD